MIQTEQVRVKLLPLGRGGERKGGALGGWTTTFVGAQMAYLAARPFRRGNYAAHLTGATIRWWPRMRERMLAQRSGVIYRVNSRAAAVSWGQPEDPVPALDGSQATL